MIALIYHLRTFVIYFVTLTILPLCWLPIFIYKIFVLSIVHIFKPNYGKTLNPVDVILEEESIRSVGNVPKSSIVNSVTIDGPLSIEELRELFILNVLNRKRSSNQSKEENLKGNNNNDNEFVPRYPELKQYLEPFMGYAFWKTDEKFSIENHIVEERYEKDNQPCLSLIHQDMINRSFEPLKSPWEMVLINNFKNQDYDGNEEHSNETKALIITRFHHSIADARSILKLFVECLGDTPLTTAEPQSTKPLRVMDVLMVPLNIASITVEILRNVARFWIHPWKVDRDKRAEYEVTPQIVRVSPKLCLRDIKDIGKKTEGTTASVILAIISGAIVRVKPEIGQLFTVYILPKDNHPETLGNHAGFGSVTLPTEENSSLQRLNKCHQAFRKLKASNMGKYLETPLYILATLFNPLRKLFVREIMSSSPVGITNIAGERDGFSIGQRKCTEFIFSVGTLIGDTGVLFCISSYRNHLRIVVVTAGGILSEIEVEELAISMGKELQSLKDLMISSQL